jgi:hypothetical protein
MRLPAGRDQGQRTPEDKESRPGLLSEPHARRHKGAQAHTAVTCS